MIYLIIDIIRSLIIIALAFAGGAAMIALGIMIPWLGLLMIIGVSGALLDKMSN